MIGSRSSAAAALSALVFIGAAAASPEAPENAAPLAFEIVDGDIRNAFFRDGPVAAHIVLRSGKSPRLVIAFPAGNSGVGLWMEAPGESSGWGEVQAIKPVETALDDGSSRYGVRFETSIDAPRLTIRKAVLSNVRVLRDYQYTGKVPAAIETAPVVGRSRLAWERRRLDGDGGYFLEVEALNGEVVRDDESVVLQTRAGGPLKLRIAALSGDAPLRGLTSDDLLTDAAQPDQRLANILAFLSYREKLLAGSWQYNTYFGRDTLMSILLLGDALAPTTVEGALGAVLERLNGAGEVAHEEDIGEHAILRRLQQGAPPSATPILDYKMIDDDFMLAPTLARYLLDRGDGRARAAAFLAQASGDGLTYADLVARNLTFVAAAARPFAEAPTAQHLIRLKPGGSPVGNWRDSEAGLGGGIFPYDVNVALVPAALRAAARLVDSGLLAAAARDLPSTAEIDALEAVWRREAPKHFRVEIPSENARAAVRASAAQVGVDPAAALAGLKGRTTIGFPALALAANGEPIPILHSDTGMSLFFGEPRAAELREMAALLNQDYPAGLMTGAGMLVANAAFAPTALHATFDKTRYHGAVIWSWQQSLMRAGLQRQLRRDNLDPKTRKDLGKALGRLNAAVEAMKERTGAELWSWTLDNGVYVAAPFGQQAGDETEANAAQLWSVVPLGRAEERSSAK